MKKILISIILSSIVLKTMAERVFNCQIPQPKLATNDWDGPYNADGEFYQSNYTTISSLNTMPGFTGVNFAIGQTSTIEIIAK